MSPLCASAQLTSHLRPVSSYLTVYEVCSLLCHMLTVFYPSSGTSQTEAETSEWVNHSELPLLRYLSEVFVTAMRTDTVVGVGDPQTSCLEI